MNSISDESLSAFLDGALPEDERARVAAAIATDERIAARLEALEAVNERVRAAWPVVSTPLPVGIETAMDRLVSAQAAKAARVAQDTNVVRLDDRRTAAPVARPRSNWPTWSLAASLLVAVGAGVLLWSQRPTDALLAFTPDSGDRLAANHPLAQTLNETPSGSTRDWPRGQTEAASVYPVLSFRDRDGALCREFEAAVADSVSIGVACRRGGAWQVEAIDLGTGRSGISNGYVPASGPVPAHISAEIDRLIAGDPLDAGAEAQALRELN